VNALLQVSDLTVTFGGVTAVDGAGFAVEEGALTGLIGPNGAGKTTVMRSITGAVQPKAGTIRLAGQDLMGLPTHRRIRAGLGLSQQIVRPFRAMTLAENVMLAAGHGRTERPLHALFSRQRAAERERALALLDLVGIGDAAGAFPAALPLGYLKRLEVARALALDPKLLLLDEPLAGLNHIEAHRLADTVLSLNERGLTIVLIEHNLGEVLRICRQLVVLDNGRKIAEGEPAKVMEQPDVRAAYLGEGDAAA